MVRGKVEMKRIENATSRQVTFSKRRNGLLKKAYELSVLCDAEVAVIIFSQKGRLYEFASSEMPRIVERYRKCARDAKNNTKFDRQLQLQSRVEAESINKKMELLQLSHRKLLGYGLDSCSLDELQVLDAQLQRSLFQIRARKAQLYKEQLQQLQEKERLLSEEKKKLSLKVTAHGAAAMHGCRRSPTSVVNTQLSI
ncbi:MADS-box protein AGL42-like isoform X2 [Benincasa hispida]|uniref:MADS-box protein AGL42-like isoform X2 n=1 Tax=Benincasa hispida TaxID=102211 RepID=UPI001900A053|nr:MADS-box protein AGL42-like isoform X2 [Benincasa hispida]